MEKAKPAEGFIECSECGTTLKKGLDMVGMCYSCYRREKERHFERKRRGIRKGN